MKKFSRFIASAAVITALSCSLSGCYFFPDEEQLLEAPTVPEEEVIYSTYTAKQKTIQSNTIVTGYVSSRTVGECYFTDYTGTVKTIHVRAGDMVEEGDLIAEMNVGTLEYDLKIQQLKVQLAQLQYNASGSQADKLQLEIEQNTLAKYQAEYDGARIYAPIAGQVSYVLGIAPGTELDPYKIVARIVDPTKLYVAAEYESTSVFAKGDKVTIKVEDDVYDAEISYTPKDAMADGAENTEVLHADFTGNTPAFGFIGKLADIVKVNSISENAVVIPKHLVKTDGSRTYVQVLRDNEKIEADIVTGISNATEIEIVSGLSAGDLVIVR